MCGSAGLLEGDHLGHLINAAWIRTRRLPAWDRERLLERPGCVMLLPNSVPGGCPFMTTFDLPDTEYAKGAAFVEMKDDAWKKVDEIKKELGDKWDEVTGKKKSS